MERDWTKRGIHGPMNQRKTAVAASAAAASGVCTSRPTRRAHGDPDVDERLVRVLMNGSERPPDRVEHRRPVLDLIDQLLRRLLPLRDEHGGCGDALVAALLGHPRVDARRELPGRSFPSASPPPPRGSSRSLLEDPSRAAIAAASFAASSAFLASSSSSSDESSAGGSRPCFPFVLARELGRGLVVRRRATPT